MGTAATGTAAAVQLRSSWRSLANAPFFEGHTTAGRAGSGFRLAAGSGTLVGGPGQIVNQRLPPCVLRSEKWTPRMTSDGGVAPTLAGDRNLRPRHIELRWLHPPPPPPPSPRIGPPDALGFRVDVPGCEGRRQIEQEWQASRTAARAALPEAAEPKSYAFRPTEP